LHIVFILNDFCDFAQLGDSVSVFDFLSAGAFAPHSFPRSGGNARAGVGGRKKIKNTNQKLAFTLRPSSGSIARNLYFDSSTR